MLVINKFLGYAVPTDFINPLNAKPVITALKTKRKKHWLLHSKSSLGVKKARKSIS